MFTGIVKELGEIVAWSPEGDTRRLVVSTRFPVENVALGASLAVNGVCLTVILAEDHEVHADIGPDGWVTFDAPIVVLVRLSAVPVVVEM